MTRLLPESAAPPRGEVSLDDVPEGLRADMISRHGHLPAHPPLRPLRIAVIGGRGVPSNYSGVEHIWEQLYGLLAARGHRITVYCRPGVITGKLGTHRGMRLVTTKAFGGPLETVTHSYASLKHACKHGDVHDDGKPFDLITLHALPPQVWAGMPRKFGIPLVSHVHGLDWQRAKWKNTPF
ncbi:MAG: glycosyltransferase, partial [Planctomycetota bacterium]